MTLLDQLVDPRPTKGTSLLNANGNYSVFGFYQGIKVKLYEPFTPAQIKLRVDINDSTLGLYFPRVIDYDDQFVIEEYIPSMNRGIDGQRIYRLMMSLRAFPAEPDFDYIDHIHKRIGIETPDTYSDLPTFVNHNDLTTDNILIDMQGSIKIIDNEMLGCNTGWVLNMLNGSSRLFSTMTDLEKLIFYGDFSEKKALDLFHNVRKKWKKKHE